VTAVYLVAFAVGAIALVTGVDVAAMLRPGGE